MIMSDGACFEAVQYMTKPCDRDAGGSAQHFCKCEGDGAVQTPCPGSNAGSVAASVGPGSLAGSVAGPAAAAACEPRASGCGIECTESDFRAARGGTSCCELFQRGPRGSLQ
ncbi:unnamed protein product [Prorocentrum cordatum]|uniref:Uncharacterized protein n=1 Tax=Prorocentrum cordatum TaxID=2364126 RepID=A0ABN9TVY4_9DINO|nr:unnamed protein product [Polarella glacialis]